MIAATQTHSLAHAINQSAQFGIQELLEVCQVERKMIRGNKEKEQDTQGRGVKQMIPRLKDTQMSVCTCGRPFLCVCVCFFAHTFTFPV